MAYEVVSGLSSYEVVSGLGSYQVVSGLGEISSAQMGTKMSTGSWCGSPNPKVMQQALDELGFPTKVDGIWGSGSLASLNAFGATRGLPKATFPTSAHCTALKQALAEKEAAAIAAAQAATQQPSTQQVPITNVAPGDQPQPVISPSQVDGGESGMSTRTMVLLGVAGVAAVGLLIAVAMSGSEPEKTAELKKNHDCDGFSCLECYPELWDTLAMIPRVADQALAMALADPAGTKAFLRNAGDKLLGIDGEPDPIIPRWTWAAVAGLGGLAFGIYVAQRFPRYMPRLAPLRKNR